MSKFGDSFWVPAAKRLVIEYVSAEIHVVGNDYALLQVGIEPPGGEMVAHYIPVTLQGWRTDQNNAKFAAGLATRLYAGPEMFVKFLAAVGPSSTSSYVYIAISGHFVNI